MEWLAPWDPVEAGEGLDDELRREVGPGHPLHRVATRTVARRQDRDDVLFALEDGTGRVAVVHLTWTSSPPEEPPWPSTRLFPSLEAWAATDLVEDHREFAG